MFSTAFVTIHDRVTAVYMARTVHGRVRAMYTYIPVHVHVYACTRQLHGRESGRLRAVTAVYRRAHGPCTRLCMGHCTWPCTRCAHGRTTVYTARVHVYTCTPAVTRKCKGRVHGPVRDPSNGRFRPCTWHVHDRVTAVSTAHVHVRKCKWPLYGRVDVRERAVYTARPVYAAV